MRTDLLALTLEDLELFSNRGTVKRAKRELDEGEVQFELEESDSGDVIVKWSDGVTSRLLKQKMLKDCKCTCGALNACRHIIRGVLAYQLHRKADRPHPAGMPLVPPTSSSAPDPPTSVATSDATTEAATSEQNASSADPTSITEMPTGCGRYNAAPASSADPAPSTAPTSSAALPSSTAPVSSADPTSVTEVPTGSGPYNDPGAICDEAMTKIVGASLLARARSVLEAGVIVELARSAKPFARFHTLAHSVRYLVIDDLRYARCDCADQPPCIHAVLGVLAFRLLAEGKSAGYINTMPKSTGIDFDLMQEVEACLLQLGVMGIARSRQALAGELKRCEQRCLEKGLIWTGEIISEILLEMERYHERDARFSSEGFSALIAECLIRFDATKSDTGAVPLQFINGMATDRAVEITSSRFVGLGCGTVLNRSGGAVVAYMQDLYSGNLITMRKEFLNKQGEERVNFAAIAEKPVLKALALADVGKGQFLIKGGKLTIAREFKPSRTAPTFNPQSFQWDLLRPPLLVESFAELRSVLDAQFPTYLSPRYAGRNFHICTVSSATDVHFNTVEQSVEATLIDAAGDTAQLYFPYLSACAAGADVLLERLTHAAANVKFVAGHVHTGERGISINPVAVVFDDGTRRTIVQPYIDRQPSAQMQAKSKAAQALEAVKVNSRTVNYHLCQLLHELGMLFAAGINSSDARTAGMWTTTAQQYQSLGFSAIAEALNRLAKLLALKSSKLDWSGTTAMQEAIQVAILALIGRDDALASD